ncbi:prevent-host-death family protein [Sphingomonas sp. UYAg733]
MSAHASIVGVRELRGKLSEYLRRVASGENFDVVSRGKKIAELRSPEPEPNNRKAGALRGKIWMADDFDTWPPEMEKVFRAIEEDDIFPPAP